MNRLPVGVIRGRLNDPAVRLKMIRTIASWLQASLMQQRVVVTRSRSKNADLLTIRYPWSSRARSRSSEAGARGVVTNQQVTSSQSPLSAHQHCPPFQPRISCTQSVHSPSSSTRRDRAR